MIKCCKRIVCLVLCAIILCSALLSASATERKTVNVGFFACIGYHDEKDGVRSGYGYDFLQHIVGYTDWKYNYIGYDKGWSEMLQMLRDGDIDLLTCAQKTEDRLKDFDFSEQSIGPCHTILTVPEGSTKYAFGDYANWDGMRIGMVRSDYRNESFERFAADNGFTYTPVYYNTIVELLDALHKGEEIDTAVSGNLRRTDGEWILAQFNPTPVYIIVKKGNTGLLSEINSALDKLLNAEPGLTSELINKYYSPYRSDSISFSPEELDYIDSVRGTPLVAIINPDYPPYSYTENGEKVGVFHDFAEMICDKCNLNITVADIADRNEYSERIKNGDYDIIFDANYNYNLAEKNNYRLTVPYTDVQTAIIYKNGTQDFNTAAMLKNGNISLSYCDAIQAQGIKISYYNSADEIVNAVMSGEVDMAYMNSETASLAVRAEATNILVCENMHGLSVEYCVAVNPECDRLLFAILNKAAASIQDPEIEAINQKYAQYSDPPFTLLGYTYDYPLHMVAFVVVLFLIAGLIVLLIQNALKQKNDRRRIAEEERRNKLLKDSLLLAEEASESKNQFLSRISHEMRTPLNAIIGFIELSREASADEISNYLTNSDIAARQLLSVINDVLDMSSIESGKLKISHSVFDFKQLLQSLSNLYTPLCKQKDVEFEIKYLNNVDQWLIGDQLRVNQILMNLLGNSVKFTSKGQIKLLVSQKETSSGEIFIHMEISDTGCGMSKEMQSRLFKPFEQESAATAQKYGGSGLGLSIVKNLISMMNGAIEVQSEVDKGTLFTVDLPFARNSIEYTENLSSSRQTRVLVVDDEETERKYLAVVLGRLGLPYTCTDNCENAMRELANGYDAGVPYTICLIDWKMPDEDGIETTKLIRKEYGNDIIIALDSAYDHNQAEETAKIAGANLFITKPLFQSKLFDLFMTLPGGQMVKNKTRLEQYDFSGKRVLLAEDNSMNRMVAQGLLKKMGITCESAEDGKIACDKFLASESGYYDAILMDIQMPNMNGQQATGVIRSSSHPDAKKIQIIALTANAFSEDVAKILASGMNAHVAKPIEPDKLAEALEKAFLTQTSDG